MDPVEDTLRRLREAFNAGRTRPAEFRVEQLKGLSRFLQDNRQLLKDALAQDLHKVRVERSSLGAAASFLGRAASSVASFSPKEEGLDI
jgi:acyl-CoA reductase-like NAD-dependent aldehyde dehydrogenase